MWYSSHLLLEAESEDKYNTRRSIHGRSHHTYVSIKNARARPFLFRRAYTLKSSAEKKSSDNLAGKAVSTNVFGLLVALANGDTS